METALETIREVDIKSSKETVIDRFTEIRENSRKSSTPYHCVELALTRKKVGTLSRKMNQLKKQLKELEV